MAAVSNDKEATITIHSLDKDVKGKIIDVSKEGEYILADQNVDDLDEKESARIRNREIGFVFQAGCERARKE